MAVDVFGALVDQLADRIAAEVIARIDAHLADLQQTGLHDAYRAPEAATKLGISEREVKRRIAAGELASIKVGRARLVTQDAIADFLANRRPAA
jgi:excisionase family DNA binding protein